MAGSFLSRCDLHVRVARYGCRCHGSPPSIEQISRFSRDLVVDRYIPVSENDKVLETQTFATADPILQ